MPQDLKYRGAPSRLRIGTGNNLFYLAARVYVDGELCGYVFMVSRAEYEVAGKGGPAAYRKCCWDGVAFELFDYDDLGIGPLGKAKDLFGDGSVLLIATPGHTPGHTSMYIPAPRSSPSTPGW